MDAFSWPVLAFYCPLGIAIQAPGNASIYGGSILLWVLSSLIGMVALAAIILGAQAVESRGGGPRPVTVLATYALAAIVQSVIFGLATVVLGAADDPELGFRLTGLIWQVPLIAAIGYAVARHGTHRRILAELEHTRNRALSLSLTADAELERVESELTGAVRASLEPALVSFEAALEQAESGSPAQEVARSLDSLVEERIRPLSHQIAGDESSHIPEIPASDARIRVPLPSRFWLSDAVRPRLTALVLLIAALPTAFRELPPVDALIYLAAFPGLVAVALTLIRRVLRGLRLPTLLGTLTVVLLYIAIGSVVFWLIGAVGLPRPGGITGSIAFLFALLGAATVGDLLVQARRGSHELQLQQETSRLDEVLALVRRREHLVRRRLAFVLHGTVQGALHAAALKITEAPAVDPGLLEGIRHDLAAALAQFSGRPPTADSTRTRETIDGLANVWGETRSVTASLDPETDQALTDDADADEAVAEVIREAANNAFRHGDARRVEIEVGFDPELSPLGSREITISVRDDGRGYPATSSPGLGTTLLEELCNSWDVSSEEGRSVLRAVIALGPRATTVGEPGITELARA